MDCPICSKEIVERNGKFGPFLCCPSGKHGTFSIQNGMMYFTGAVGNLLKEDRKATYSAAALSQISKVANLQQSFTGAIDAQMAAWGWNSGGDMEQLAEFALGSPESMWDDDDRELGSHWRNDRSY